MRMLIIDGIFPSQEPFRFGVTKPKCRHLEFILEALNRYNFAGISQVRAGKYANNDLIHW